MKIVNTKRPANPEPEGATRVGSVRTFLDALEKLELSREHVLFFRGHDNFSYSLKPAFIVTRLDQERRHPVQGISTSLPQRIY